MQLLKINNKKEKKADDALKKQTVQEITVERKPVAAAISVWHIAMMMISGCFALIGLLSLAMPELRACLLEIFLQFAYEIDIFPR